ncbi:mck1 dosage suppressor [Scheffersomyces spartinae]|uniref:Mck1 dosage suppressor n=1 Tax=Scheffersomyces spartinae TaxID=45513 RepID=A0A9P7V872_9ASCO|nr:mck1 dosage suppressor [Scheffersomyces spartinae]KAG7193210.1 mck1 dosage suppressor [Scheffersomyces spartinae]
MSTLVPAASTCFPLTLPRAEKDDRFNLNVRTGSASTLYNSFVFTFGGLTIGLELPELTINEIFLTFESKVGNAKSRSLATYLSGEFFYLSILERSWTRLEFDHSKGFLPRPVPRAFHEICAVNNYVYVFGGLRIKEAHKDRKLVENLVPSNDLWEFNLATTKWTCLHDGSGWDTDASIPKPRFCPKMTIVNNLSFVNKKGHMGIFIAGGKDTNSEYIYDNAIFDLVEKKYVVSNSGGSFYLKATSGNEEKDERVGLNQVVSTNGQKYISVDYTDSVIVSYDHTVDPNVFRSSLNHAAGNIRGGRDPRAGSQDAASSLHEESIIIYTPTKNSNPRLEKGGGDDNMSYQSSFKEPKNYKSAPVNPLVSFKLGKTMKNGKPLPLHMKRSNFNRIGMVVPFNLRYPTGGLFGQNLVIVGFLPNDLDISVFVYNIPTGKWSRLNVFCNHDYGSHRFWGGFVWESHHKVVLIGNQHTSRTTSSIRYFTTMITISLPITNLLASWELANDYFTSSSVEAVAISNGLQIPTSSISTSSTTSTSSSDDDGDYSNELLSDTEDSDDDANIIHEPSTSQIRPSRRLSTQIDNANKGAKNAISFADYIYYAAPKAKFSTISSVFPPAAVTLGRNAFDRYGDLISDFEFVSANGDRIPVSTHVLIERWGSYFVNLLARGYIKAVCKFQQDSLNSSPAGNNNNIRTSNASSLSLSQLAPGQKSGKQLLSASLSLSQSSQSDSHQSRHLSPEPFNVAPPGPQGSPAKEIPQFRLPFQDSDLRKLEESSAPSSRSLFPGEASSTISSSRLHTLSQSSAVDPHTVAAISHSVDPGPLGGTSGSSMFMPELSDIPAQLPLPMEPIPMIPTTTSFKSASRKNSSSDVASPRNSIIHTLTSLRNIPMPKSPRDSPFNSPRVSISVDPGENLDHHTTTVPQATPLSVLSSTSTTNTVDSDLLLGSALGISDESHDSPGSFPSSGHPPHTADTFTSKQEMDPSSILDASAMMDENGLLNFDNLDPLSYKMEASLIPRKLYVPFSTNTIKAFCEYLYTGQIGDKWLLSPTSLDCLALSKFFNVPLLYNLITETLFGIIGRKEGANLRKWKKFKKKYINFISKQGIQLDPEYTFPFDEFEGFVDTVDDGYLDIVLLKKSSNYHKTSHSKCLLSSEALLPGKLQSNVAAANEGGSLALPDGNTDSPLDSTEAVPDLQEKEDDDEELDEEYIDGTEMDLIESGLGYLDNHDTSFVNPKSRPTLRKTSHQQATTMYNEDEEADFNSDEMKKQEDELEYARKQLLNVTLAELVSPKAPIPSDYAIGLIYESAALVTDVKLMLRAMNARQMSKMLLEEETRLMKEMESILRKKDPSLNDEEISKTIADALSKDRKGHKHESDQKNEMPTQPSQPQPQPQPQLKPVHSLTTLSSKTSYTGILERTKSNLEGLKLERTKSNNSLKSIFSMTPVKKTILGEGLNILNLGNSLASGYGSAIYSPTGIPAHYASRVSNKSSVSSASSAGSKASKLNASVHSSSNTTTLNPIKSASKSTLTTSNLSLTINVINTSLVSSPTVLKSSSTVEGSPVNSIDTSRAPPPPTREISRSKTEPFPSSPATDNNDDNHSIGGASTISNATSSTGIHLRFFHLHRKDSNNSLEATKKDDNDSDAEKHSSRKKFGIFGRKK